ncbi:MAG TPA: drug/metabolite exporter YedA [Gemmatimonadaceae bacterium]|jgi:drug/metabolite transporter (DMT)-like permease|nr:drug/metabolite exporter YedA [Gemmatimonadaceae bacterium]
MPMPVSVSDRDAARGRVIGAFAAVYVVWGSTYLAIRYAVESMPPLLMAGSRFAVSGAILYAWARLRGASKPTAAEWRTAAITGFLLICIGNGSVAWAERRVPSGLAALLVAVVPLWMVLLDWIRPGGVRPRKAVVAGVIIGLIGLAVLVGRDSLTGQGGVDALGAGVLVAASMSWAIGSVYNRHGARPDSAAMSTALQMLGGSVSLLVLGFALGETGGIHMASITRASWLGWGYLVTFGALLGFTAYIYLLRNVSPAKASTYAYVNPVVAVILGWAVAGEVVTPRTVLAAAIILGGVAMITIARSRRVTLPGE